MDTIPDNITENMDAPSPPMNGNSFGEIVKKNYFQKMMSDDKSVQFKKHLSLLIALIGASMIIYCVFIRGNIVQIEETLIEFLFGFSVLVYGGPNIASKIINRNVK